ncbi:MAG: hypothetical protein ACRD91_03175 [Nitrosopumilaceae archaeon]
MADEPITEGIDFEIEAQSEDGDRKKLDEIIKLAEERCPAIYSMSHIIKVNARIK